MSSLNSFYKEYKLLVWLVGFIVLLVVNPFKLEFLGASYSWEDCHILLNDSVSNDTFLNKDCPSGYWCDLDAGKCVLSVEQRNCSKFPRLCSTGEICVNEVCGSRLIGYQPPALPVVEPSKYSGYLSYLWWLVPVGLVGVLLFWRRR